MAAYLTFHNHLISKEKVGVNTFINIHFCSRNFGLMNKDNRSHIYLYTFLEMVFVLTCQELFYISSSIVCKTDYFLARTYLNKACYYILNTSSFIHRNVQTHLFLEAHEQL